MTDGEDVRQLERNLKALGHDPGDVDDDWDSDTTAAVKRFQRARGLYADGTLARGEIVFRDGPVRMGEAKAALGDSVAPGRPVASISSVARRVTVQLDATRQELARVGDKVTVDLPTGRTTSGRITSVGKVASKASADADASIEVTITLRGAGGGFDQAPVDVGFAVERADDVLAVPVKALLGAPGRRLRARARVGTAGGGRDRALRRRPGRGLRRRPARGRQGGDGAMTAVLRLLDVCKSYPGGRGRAARRLADRHRRARRSPSSGRPARASRRCCT